MWLNKERALHIVLDATSGPTMLLMTFLPHALLRTDFSNKMAYPRATRMQGRFLYAVTEITEIYIEVLENLSLD